MYFDKPAEWDAAAVVKYFHLPLLFRFSQMSSSSELSMLALQAALPRVRRKWEWDELERRVAHYARYRKRWTKGFD